MNKLEENMIIKARLTNLGERTARRININRDVRLEDLEYMLCERFGVSNDKRIELFYLDEDNDRVVVSFEDELALALDSKKVPTLEIAIKPKVVNSEFTYPQVPKGKPGDCAEVLVESRYLTLINAINEETKAWGTSAYTEDSDIVKTLVHSQKIDLPYDPPPYNIIVTIRFIPGNLKYIGTTSQGVTTLSYGPYETSYIIDGYRTVPILNETCEESSRRSILSS